MEHNHSDRSPPEKKQKLDDHNSDRHNNKDDNENETSHHNNSQGNQDSAMLSVRSSTPLLGDTGHSFPLAASVFDHYELKHDVKELKRDLKELRAAINEMKESIAAKEAASTAESAETRELINGMRWELQGMQRYEARTQQLREAAEHCKKWNEKELWDMKQYFLGIEEKISYLFQRIFGSKFDIDGYVASLTGTPMVEYVKKPQPHPFWTLPWSTPDATVATVATDQNNANNNATPADGSIASGGGGNSNTTSTITGDSASDHGGVIGGRGKHICESGRHGPRGADHGRSDSPQGL